MTKIERTCTEVIKLEWRRKKNTHFRLKNKTCLVVAFVLQSSHSHLNIAHRRIPKKKTLYMSIAHSYLSIAHRRIPIISQTVSWPALLLVLPVGDKNQCNWGSISCYNSRTMAGLQRVRYKLI